MERQRLKADSDSSPVSVDRNDVGNHADLGHPPRDSGGSTVVSKATQFTIHSEDAPLSHLVLLASIFEPSVDVSISGISSDPAAWPSILNLTRTIAPEEIVALADWQNNLQMDAEVTDRKVSRFVEQLQKDPRWKGHSEERTKN